MILNLLYWKYLNRIIKINIIIFIFFCANILFAQDKVSNFNRADINKDDKIAKSEFRGPINNFNRFDKNRDGFVTKEEFGISNSDETESKKFISGDGMQGKGKPKGTYVSEKDSPVKIIRVKTKDAHFADASYRVPTGKGKFPTIIFIHGGIAKFAENQRKKALIKDPVPTGFLNKGYIVVQSTFRTYKENPQSKGPILDNMAIIDAVKKISKVDIDNIIVMGGSGGGSITLDLLALRNDIKLAVVGEPATVIFTGVFGGSDSREKRFDCMYNFKKYYTAKRKKITEEKIAKFATPILFLNSNIHPLNEINKNYIIPAIKNAGKEVREQFYPKVPHGFYWGDGVSKKFVEKLIKDIDNAIKNISYYSGLHKGITSGECWGGPSGPLETVH